MEKPSVARNKVLSSCVLTPWLRNLVEWLRHDSVVGVLVAAVVLPTAIAYVELIVFEISGGTGRWPDRKRG